LPIGAEVWSVPPFDGVGVQDILHGHTSDTTHPSVYALSNSTIYALSSDGQLLWTNTNDLSDPSFLAATVPLSQNSPINFTRSTKSTPAPSASLTSVSAQFPGLHSNFPSAMALLEIQLRQEARSEAIPGPKTRALNNFLTLMNSQPSTATSSPSKMTGFPKTFNSQSSPQNKAVSAPLPAGASAAVTETIVATMEDNDDGLVHLILGSM
jgi:hypothetical protein